MNILEPIAVKDLITNKYFPAAWMIVPNNDTRFYLGSDCRVSNVRVPRESFLGRILLHVLEPRKSSYIFTHGYPISIISLKDGVREHIYILREVEQEINIGSPQEDLPSYLFRLGDASPLVVSEVLEDLKEIYENGKEIKYNV